MRSCGTLSNAILHRKNSLPNVSSHQKEVSPLDQKSRTRIAVLIAIVMVAAVFGSFGFSLFSSQPPRIVLPTIQTDSGTDLPSLSDDDHGLRVEVTIDTVQAVIASLNRTSSYYRQLSVQTFWGSDSSTTSVQTWADDSYVFVRSALPSGQARYTLTTPDDVYYWYGGSSTWLTAPKGSLSGDLSQRIPTYEDVLALDKQDISAAGYESFDNHPCIYVETRLDELNYRERYWVSVESGLLVAAQTLKEDMLVYSVNATAPIQTPCPTDSVFALPNGTVLHSF